MTSLELPEGHFESVAISKQQLQCYQGSFKLQSTSLTIDPLVESKMSYIDENVNELKGYISL